MRGCKQRRSPLLTQKQNLDYKDNHGCTTVPLPVSARLVSPCLKFKKSSNCSCATNFQQTKISPRQWTHSACPSTQFMITKRKHIQKLAKEASDRARQAFCYSVATVSIPFFNLRLSLVILRKLRPLRPEFHPCSALLCVTVFCSLPFVKPCRDWVPTHKPEDRFSAQNSVQVRACLHDRVSQRCNFWRHVCFACKPKISLISAQEKYAR